MNLVDKILALKDSKAENQKCIASVAKQKSPSLVSVNSRSKSPSLAKGDLGGGSIMTDESLRGKAKAIHKESNIDCHEVALKSTTSRNDDATNNDEVSELENQIDKLVYALYDLNESEIKLIESK